jgi:hypothetical protein
MDKGIRPACNAKFLELLPTRVNTREGNTAFRKSVIAFVMEEYGTTLASAATHYNHAFIAAREAAAKNTVLATQLEGLGRPEDKKGGRKPKAKPAQPTNATGNIIPANPNALLQNFINAGVPGIAPPAAQITNAAAQVGLEGLGQQEETPEGGEEAGEETTDEAPQGGEETAPPVALYSVWKVVKNTMVAENLTKEQADELVEKAAQAKKAKLEARPQ